MAEKQINLVHNLRLELLRAGYPEIYIVDNEILEAVECNILEHLKSLGYPEILVCGDQGLLFKGVQLVLKI